MLFKVAPPTDEADGKFRFHINSAKDLGTLFANFDIKIIFSMSLSKFFLFLSENKIDSFIYFLINVSKQKLSIYFMKYTKINQELFLFCGYRKEKN